MMYGISGIEWIMILLFICIPILVILGLVGLGVYVYDRNRGSARQNQGQVNPISVTPAPTIPKADRYCSHCGTALQADWSHCPQCGAPVS
jgi:hypothetical protein